MTLWKVTVHPLAAVMTKQNPGCEWDPDGHEWAKTPSHHTEYMNSGTAAPVLYFYLTGIEVTTRKVLI